MGRDRRLTRGPAANEWQLNRTRLRAAADSGASSRSFRHFCRICFPRKDDETGRNHALMNTFLSNLTAAMLVIHAMIGCCHHHWHRADEAAAAPAISMACACCCHGEQAGDEEQVPTEPCSGELQCQGVCTYLPSQKTAIDASPMASPFDYAVVPQIASSCRLAITESTWDSSDGTCNSLHPPTLHRLHQLLLI
jgi:hypothetical protein